MVEQLRRAVPGGIGTYAAGLAKGLSTPSARARVEATLFATPVGGVDPLGGFGLPVAAGSPLVPAHAQRVLWGRGAMGAPRGYDLVHATSFAFPPTPAPLVVAVHDLAWRLVPHAYPSRGRRWHERALSRALAQAVTLVAPTAEVADQLVAAGARPGQVRQAHLYGCDHLPPPDEDAAASALAMVGAGEKFVACVGTLEPRKNLRRLVQAWGLARARLGPDWSLVIVGPKGWGPGLSHQEGVVFTGSVSPGVLSGIYSKAALVAYVPLAEGFGLPVLEAMLLGTPVVASGVPSAGGAALEVDPTSVGSIAEGLIAVASDQTLADRLSSAGRDRAAGLSWEAAALAHIGIWESVW